MSERGQRGQQPAPQAPVEQPMMGEGKGISQVAMMPAHEYKAIMQAKVFEEADKIRTQETRPGGAFVVEGQWVDANGRPLKDSDIADLETRNVKAETASDEQIEYYDKTTPTLLNEAPEQLEEQRKGQEDAAKRAREEAKKAQA